MVPNIARFIILDQRRHYPVCRSVLLSTFEKDLYCVVSGMEIYTSILLHVLPILIPTLSVLLTSSLEWISIYSRHQMIPWTDLKGLLSSVIMCCRPSFMKYSSPILLSNTAPDHWIQHPQPSSFPVVFLPFRGLTLRGGATCGWPPMLGCGEGGTPTTQRVTPSCEVKGLWKVLNIK